MDHRSGEAMSRVMGLAEVDTRIVMLQGYETRIELFVYHNPIGKDWGVKAQCDFGITHFALSV